MTKYCVQYFLGLRLNSGMVVWPCALFTKQTEKYFEYERL